MTNERAVEILNFDLDILGQYGDETAEAYKMAIKALEQEEVREHMDMLIAHKDNAIETHPYFKRCDSCIHSEEQDGSNCYECVKGMSDNFEAQPKTSYISIDVNKFAKEVAEKALDEITYEGKTIREWAELLVKQQPCEDAISRAEALRYSHIEYDDDGEGHRVIYTEDIEELPSVTPRINLALTSQDCISREEVQDLISRWLSDYLLDETREALETINYKVGDMPSVTPERPKGKWIEVLEHRDEFGSTWHYECSECRGRSYKGFEPLERCCPNCGAEMSGGGEDEET